MCSLFQMYELSFGSTKGLQPTQSLLKNNEKLRPASPITEFGTHEDVKKSLQDEERPFSLKNRALSRSASMSASQKSGKNPVGKPPISGTQTSEGHKSFHSTKAHTLTDEVVHVAAETYLLTHLTIILLGYLGLGYRWITKCIALMFYAAFLMPGFIQVGWYYFFSKNVHRSIVYGDQPRNRLDLYLPQKSNKPKPAVAFVTGGAWIIGYKAWGALLAQELVEEDVIVACIDYRNFPQGTVSDMVADVSAGLSFFCKNIAEYGGDPDRLYLAGQSAGAHLSACALMEQVRKETLHGQDKVAWRASQFKAYFGISGGYNLPDLVDHFHGQGLYRSIFLSIMEGEDSLDQYSPELAVQNSNLNITSLVLPQIVLLHGTADYSIPYDASVTFADALRAQHLKVTTILYKGKTHTDLFLQDPMRGGKDELLRDILAIINENDEAAKIKFAGSPPRRRLVPEFLLQLARKVSPF